MRTLLAIVIGTTCISAPAVAISGSAGATQEQAENKVICKRDRNSFSTGSHLSKPRKTCMKAFEWKELEAESQRNIDKLRDRPGVDPEHVPLSGGGPG